MAGPLSVEPTFRRRTSSSATAMAPRSHRFSLSPSGSARNSPTSSPSSERSFASGWSLREGFRSVVSSITSLGSVEARDRKAVIDEIDDTGKRAIQIPDLFSSIMSVPCEVCPHYESARKKSEAYITKKLGFDEKARKKNNLIDFTYMSAAWAPQADEESLVTLADWMHWTFYFDDQFDEGHLSADPVKGAEEIDAMLRVLEDGTPFISAKEHALQHVYQDVWRRFKLRAPEGLQKRFIKASKDYCEGVLNQVRVNRDSIVITLDQYMDFRRQSIGTYPSFALIEYCHGIDLPQSVIDHPSIATCEEVASDITILHNDILSYKKDLEQGVQHNIIVLLVKQGMTEQDAVDHVNVMLEACFRRWYGAMAEMPAWGERVDRDVLRYLDACRNVAIGNLYWSFKSGRYFGRDGPRVRETRVMLIPDEAKVPGTE